MPVMAGQNSRYFAWRNTHVCVVRLCSGDRPCSLRGTYWGLRKRWGSECLPFYDTSAGNRISFHLREKYKKCDISKFTRYMQDAGQNQGNHWQCKHNVPRGEQHSSDGVQTAVKKVLTVPTTVWDCLTLEETGTGLLRNVGNDYPSYIPLSHPRRRQALYHDSL